MDVDLLREQKETLQRGADLLGTLLLPIGFEFEFLGAGKGSGGAFAFGHFQRGKRRLEFHVRNALGLVRYHFGDRSMSHEDYMHAFLEKRHASNYPGFSGGPMDGFRDLLSDLANFGTDFLAGSDDRLLQRIEQANRLSQSSHGLPE